MNINIISASPRVSSNSLKVANFLKANFEINDDYVVKITDFADCDIPMVGKGSVSRDSISSFQKTLLSHWSNAGLIIMILPEYNFGTSGEFLNAIDQLGNVEFAHLFNDKVFAFVGVSSGRGGRLPCIDVSVKINKLVGFLGQQSVVSPLFYESHETSKNLDNEGGSTGNLLYEKGIANFINYTLKIANRWHKIPVKV